jgi:hypothetical protein
MNRAITRGDLERQLSILAYRLKEAEARQPSVDAARPITAHVVLHRNGDPIHFDVTVNLQAIVQDLGRRAERNRSHVTMVAGGGVRVEHIP